MKKSIKSIVLGMVTVALLAGCFGNNNTSSDSKVSSNDSSSTVTSETSTTSSSASESKQSSTSTSTTQSTTQAPSSSSSSSSSSSEVVKTQIQLSAAKTTLEINEEVLITSNVENVTFTVGEGATVVNNVFKATEAGEFRVRATKEGDFIQGEITFTVLQAKENIVLSATKTELDVNEPVTINSNIEGVTLTTSEGATIENGVFVASKEGTYIVTGTKEGRYNDGTLTINVSFKVTEEKVKSALKALKETENYTLAGENDMGAYAIYRTPDYFYNNQTKEGMGLFTNIDSEIQGERVAHYIKMVDNNLVIGNDIMYKVDNKAVPATDLYKIDIFHYVDIDALTFEEHDGHFVTTDEYLIAGMTNVLDSIIVAYGCIAVQYSFNEKYELVVNVLFTEDGETISYESAAMLGDLTYTNVGSTKAPVLDEEYKKATVAAEGMSEEVASSFMLKQAHIKTSIKIITGESVEDLGTSEYRFDEQYLVQDQFVARTNSTTHNFYVNDEGYAKFMGIGPNNQIVTSYANLWESFTFPFSTLDTTQFRQTGEHTYSYLGQESHAVACDLAWASVGDNRVAYITAHEENGKIVSFTCETANELVDISKPSDEEANYVIRKLVMEVEVLPYEAIVAPTPFEADADTVRIGAYLEELMGADANYSLYIGDQSNYGNWKNIKITADTILIDEWKDYARQKYIGYHKLSDGSVVKFSAKRNGDDVADLKYESDVELAEGQPLVSLLGLNLAPEAMMFNEDNDIVFKDGVLYGGDGLYNQFTNNRYAIDGTIVFKVGYSDHITGINYDYGKASNAKEFCYTSTFGTTAFNDKYEKALLPLLDTIKDAPTPTTWREESEDIYNNLVTLLGDYATEVPYVYDVAYSGNYTSNVYSETTVYIKVPTNNPYSDSFKAAFIAACVENGYTKNTEKKATKSMGDKSISVTFISATLAVQYK